mmetsp:Transcript_98684/g.166111  ORF Transcript_98684/g.166111 Transcript_98684/m.166111 type:complete len:217 (+) Transcript_98684:274-924(+)
MNFIQCTKNRNEYLALSSNTIFLFPDSPAPGLTAISSAMFPIHWANEPMNSGSFTRVSSTNAMNLDRMGPSAKLSPSPLIKEIRQLVTSFALMAFISASRISRTVVSSLPVKKAVNAARTCGCALTFGPRVLSLCKADWRGVIGCGLGACTAVELEAATLEEEDAVGCVSCVLGALAIGASAVTPSSSARFLFRSSAACPGRGPAGGLAGGLFGNC